MQDNNQDHQINNQEFSFTDIRAHESILRNLDSSEPFNGVDIFNDITKLPESCKNELKNKSLNINYQRILDLFQFKDSISIDEIIIAIYNLHKLQLNRALVCSRLNLLNKKGYIQKIPGKKGTYSKI